MKLYEIVEEIAIATETLFKEAIENDGEINDRIHNMLEGLEMEKAKKISSIACMIKNAKADVEALKAEEKAFANRRKVKENEMNSLKMYLASWIPGEKYEDNRCKISWRKSESVEVDLVQDVPDKFIQIVEKPKTVEIKKALKAGEEVPGARLIENNNIQIK